MTRKNGRAPQKTPPPPIPAAAPSGPQHGRFIGRRLVAWWLDTTVLTVLITRSGVGSPTARWLAGLAIVVIVDWLGVARFGATPGKALLGLRVSSTTQDRLGWYRPAVRTAAKQLPTALYLVVTGLFASETLELTPIANTVVTTGMIGLWLYIFGPALSDSEGRGRHDRLAGTSVVLRQRTRSNRQ